MDSPERHPLKMGPDVQDPLESFQQGIFEPENLSDNSPLRLSLLCTKLIIENIQTFSFKHELPVQVGDDLLEVFRLIGKKNMCGRLLSELKSKRCPIKKADFSGFDLKNKEVIDFLEAHSSTLCHLNLSQCNLLTKDLCKQLIDPLITVKDPLKLYRQVTCYEVDSEEASKVPLDFQFRGDQFLWRKIISNQHLTLTTVENKSAGNVLQQVTTVKHLEHPLLTELEMYSALGMLDSPELIDKLLQHLPSVFNVGEGHPKLKMSDYRTLNLGGDNFEYTISEDGSNYTIYPKSLSAYRSAHDESDDEDLEEIEELRANEDLLDSSTHSRAACCPEQTPQMPTNIQSHWMTQYSRQQQQNLAPKRLNNSAMPYRRVNRSSSSAAGAHISRRFENTSSASTSSHVTDLPMSSCQQATTASNLQQGSFDVQMLVENNNNNDSEAEVINSIAKNNERNSLTTNTRQAVHANVVEQQEQHLQQQQLQNNQSTLPSNATTSSAIINNLLNSPAAPGTGGPPATSASCPSLDSSIFIMASGSANGATLQHVDRTPANHLPRSTRANSQNAYNSELSQFDTFSSLSFSSNQPVRSTTSQSAVRDQQRSFNYFRLRTSKDWPSTSSASTSSPPSPSSLFTNEAFAPSLFSTRRESSLLSNEKVKFLPYQVFTTRSHHRNKTYIFEVRTWEESPLESLMLGKSVIPNTEELSVSEIAEVLFHPSLTNLKRLAIHEWPMDVTQYISPNIDQAIADRLLVLDLSYCNSVGDGLRLTKLRNLQKLILYNTPKAARALDAICKIKSLRHLDLSTSNDNISHQFQDPDVKLKQLVESLPNLSSLDISGTNLAGFRQDIIMGLEPRKNNPLEFLGIFHTSIEASARQNIPAKRIAGDTYENYILNSCEAYIDRVHLLRMSLNELFQLFRYESRQHDLERSLKILVCALGRHPGDKLVQVAASATLFYIVKSEEAKPHLGRRIKELIVSRLLDAMQAFRFDQTMLRNGCLNLIHFRIPADVITEYSRLADILLYIVTAEEDDFVQRLGIYLLNSLACQVDGEQKTIVGNLGAIEKMLQLIETRCGRGVCDELMETAWSCMWNVTDETPINCERFLNSNGLEFFKSCHDKFANCPELLRNMMGLLGNVSECAYLRYRLMKQDYISRFVALLDSQSDGIEVSYNSAGILAHIASDGADIWNRYLDNVKCPREEMLERMERAISRWEINSKRNINYRSFEPILRLLRVLSISWQAQYWAVWALANLTRVHCSKYCRLLEKDGGVEVLKSFLTAQRPVNFQLPISVKRLAALTLFHVYLYQEYNDLRGLEKSNTIFKSYQNIHGSMKKRMRKCFNKFGIAHLSNEFGWPLYKTSKKVSMLFSVHVPDSEESCESSEKDSDEGVGEEVEDLCVEEEIQVEIVPMEDEPPQQAPPEEDMIQ